jgi:four helix bundle protein
MEKIKSFNDLRVWEEAHRLTLGIYSLTKGFPKEEMFGITSQIRRAAASIPTNIAEGSGRYSTKEFIQFLITARSSLEELKYLLLLSGDLNYITEEKFNEIYKSTELIGKMLNKLITSLRKKIK